MLIIPKYGFGIHMNIFKLYNYFKFYPVLLIKIDNAITNLSLIVQLINTIRFPLL